MGDRKYLDDLKGLNKRLMWTFYDYNDMVQFLHYIERKCKKKRVMILSTMSYNAHGEFYNLFIDVNENHVDFIREIAKFA